MAPNRSRTRGSRRRSFPISDSTGHLSNRPDLVVNTELHPTMYELAKLNDTPWDSGSDLDG
jgi:hypothetical protein